MNKRLLFISILCLSLTTALAQEAFIRAYTDQQVYIAGEKIWISGKKIGSQTERKEPVRVYLFDRAGNLMERVTAMDDEGNIGCYIQLQGNLRTDSYLVAVNVNGSKPQYIPVVVVNPIIPPERMQSIGSPVLGKKLGTLQVRTNKEVYGKRELVELMVDTLPEMDLQISVMRNDILSSYVDSLFQHWHQPDFQIVENLLEGEGQQIKLSVYNSSDQLVPGVRVFASVLGDQANIATALSDRNGIARIALPYPYGDVSLVFSAVGEPGEAYRLVYEDAGVQIRGTMDLPVIQLDERFRSSINDRLLNAEVANKFRPEAKISYRVEGLDTTDFYGKPDMRYMLDDYTRIPNMEEILFEYIQQVRVRRLGEKPAILVFNTPFKTFFELPAMVLLDGVPVSDLAQLLALDPLQLKSVDVVARRFLLDEMQLPGIVHYKSYKADLGGYKLPAQDVVYSLRGNAIPVEPVFPNHSDKKDDRIPDMRNLLYWTPFHRSVTGRTVFYTPDCEGEYIVCVRGVDKSGKEFMGEMVIRIK